MKAPKKYSPIKPTPNMWDSKESVKSESLRNEQRLSKKLGFTLNPGSGNTPWMSLKGDGRTKEFMFECKETKKARISVGEKDLIKLCREASIAGKEPILVISMYGVSEGIPQDWVVIPAHLLESDG